MIINLSKAFPIQRVSVKNFRPTIARKNIENNITISRVRASACKSLGLIQEVRIDNRRYRAAAKFIVTSL
jgi:hypothetical protein